MIRPTIREAYDFFREGTVALAEMEHNGILVDKEYLDKAMHDVSNLVKGYETKIKDSDLYDKWRRRFRDVNLESVQQLGTVLESLGYQSKELTPTKKPKWDERQLERFTTKLPIITDFIACKKLRKVQGTYLKGILRELDERSYLHPSYNLAGGMEDDKKGGAMSYRGSSSNPNFQNLPIRNKLMGKIIRSCFVAPPGYWLGEIDFSTIEVRIAACVTKDRNLIDYVVHSPPKDMHRDAAQNIFFLKEHEVEKKGPRDAAKNRFVFPEFYGSYYVDCARNMWEMMERSQYKVKDSDELVKDRLRKHGITKLGKCDEELPPVPGTFEYHVKEFETKFWNDKRWFWEYTNWKKAWYNKYLTTGEVPMPTGFVARGVYRRNQVLNLPIQGPAFHCLLWSIIEIQKELRQRKMKSRLVGQIHDCLLPYIWKPETQRFLDLCHEVMTERLPEAWKWIIVPLETETDIVPEGQSWNEKASWVKKGELWQAV